MTLLAPMSGAYPLAPIRRRAARVLVVGRLCSELVNGLQDAVRVAGVAIQHRRGAEEALSVLACKRVRPTGVLIHGDLPTSPNLSSSTKFGKKCERPCSSQVRRDARSETRNSKGAQLPTLVANP
jgi:hypothetical protein